jgi:hypothetical protein
MRRLTASRPRGGVESWDLHGRRAGQRPSSALWDDVKPEMIALLGTTWCAVLQGTSGCLVRWVEGTGQEKARGAHW